MENSVFQNNAVFFIEVDKINPNPFQPRREFDPARLEELADSIRMYGILQPLVVTRKEVVKEDGGLSTEYELIAGERRLRASKLAGLREVPALIRSAEDDDRTKLELAIIENLQREDLNAIDRALAFKQLADQFNFSHAQIGKKVGRSREYVSNTLRLLMLPEDMQDALKERKISEGHTRPLLMLIDRPEEQNVLFKEIILRKMTVRDAEKVARRIAYDKVRKKDKMYNPEIVEMEEEVSGVLGTRVHIEKKDKGGRIEIDFFDEESLKNIMEVLRANAKREDPFAKFPQSNIVAESTGDLREDDLNKVAENSNQESVQEAEGNIDPVEKVEEKIAEEEISQEIEDQVDFPEEDSVSHEEDESEDELYSVDGFTI
jgi:ParB family chromosome partitioning protein